MSSIPQLSRKSQTLKRDDGIEEVQAKVLKCFHSLQGCSCATDIALLSTELRKNGIPWQRTGLQTLPML